MHFWIDKRSQAYSFNGRHGVPASLASARRRRKSMVTPVHRFQAMGSAIAAQQLRRPYQQQLVQPRAGSHQVNHCQSSVVSASNEPINESVDTRATPPTEVGAAVYLDTPLEGSLDAIPHAQLMRLGGLTKYGMWASFGLTTVSVAATKFYVDHQGVFEILLLCALGVLSAGILVSCILAVCRRTPQPLINVHITPTQPIGELEIPEGSPQRDNIITPMPNSLPVQQSNQVNQDEEEPPPPYHIAILLPVKGQNYADLPPPTYESAVR